MPPLKAGQEVDSWCTKCKMDLLHRIVAVFNGKPVNVECRTCKSVHRYRAPKNGPAAIAANPTKTASGPASPRASRKSRPPEPVALVPPPNARVHPYRMTERFMRDQWISHKTFGVGLVTGLVGTDKIEVRFDAGSKVLVHGVTE